MANTLKDNQSNVICGLGIFTHTCASNGMYKVNIRCSEVPISGIVVSTKLNAGSPIVATAPAASQSTVNLENIFNCVATDVITVTLSSAVPIDNQLNTVKSIVSIVRISG